MNINATVFVQAINFFITYWMLRLFLFKPVISIIEHEKVQECGKLDLIAQQKKSLEIQEKERQAHWYICQEYFNTHRPCVSKKNSYINIVDFMPDKTSKLDHLAPPSHKIADIIAETYSIIEEKIKHVH